MADDLRRIASAPDSYHLRTTILVHGRRRQPFGTCPCCDSPHAEIVKTVVDYDRAVVVPGTGKRYVLELDAPEIRRFHFDRQADRTESNAPITLRCTEEQYALLVDDTSRVVGALGGLGSGKTMAMLSWFTRKWVRRGGPGARFWLISSELEGSYFMLSRWIDGDWADDRQIDPILPRDKDGDPLLVVSRPKSGRMPDKLTTMVDGSLIDLKHAAYRAGSLKRVSLQAALTDETCEFRNPSSWDEIVGRTRESRGQVGFSTIPEEGHWLQAKLAERGDTDRIQVKSLSLRDNCWLDKREYEVQAELIGDEATKRRMLDGEWTKTGPKVWVHWNRERHTVSGVARDCEGYNVYVDGEKRKLLSLNEAIGPSVFPFHQGGWRFLLGQDFNAWPMGTIVWQLCYPEGTDPHDPDNWHAFVSDEVWTGSSTRPSTIFAHCEYMLQIHEHRELEEGAYSKLAVSCDASGSSHDSGRGHDDGTTSMIDAMNEYGYTAQPCRYSIPSTFKSVSRPQNPSIAARCSMMHRLMRDDRLHVHAERCRRFVHSIENQISTDRGTPKKNPGTASDRQSSLPDAGGYGLWPFFGEPYMPVSEGGGSVAD